MKIVHTSDIHLRSTDDARWRAFEEVVRLARNESAELLVISGDLFDRRRVADSLRTEMRSVFESLPGRVLILPGNHDESAFGEGHYFGDRVTVMNDPAAVVELEGVRVAAMPFEETGTAGVVERLIARAARTGPECVDILLFHGELLDMFYDPGRFGDEEGAGYMPVHLSDFDDLGFEYVLAGHFHSQFESRSFRGGYFVYPGSPVSVTRREQGRRAVNLFQTGDPPAAHPLDSFHYQTVEYRFDPFRSGNLFEEIESRLAACHPQAEIDLVAGGFVDLERAGLSEELFKQKLDAYHSEQVVHISHQWRNIGMVLQHELFRRFEDHLRTVERDRELKEKMRRMAIEAIMGVINAD